MIDDKIDTNELLTKAIKGSDLSRKEIIFLLELSDEDHIGNLFQAARDLRYQYFGNKIFLYGFLYLSTYCRNNCIFCNFRKSNTSFPRYRKSETEIVIAARLMAESGVNLIDLTMGEDPVFFNKGPAGFDRLIKIIKSVHAATQLPIMVSPGVVPDSVLGELKKAGAHWYACYQETHQQKLFKQLRPDQSYDDRLRKKVTAHRAGLLIEEGLLNGIGESADDVAESMMVMRNIDADQIRTMDFVPQQGTPMENWISQNHRREQITMAVMRLVMPDRLIPATLDVDGLEGLQKRLDAGANVVTSLVPSGLGLAGVAQSSLDIEDSRRTRAGVVPVLEQNGLHPASNGEYADWVQLRLKQNSSTPLSQKDGIKTPLSTINFKSSKQYPKNKRPVSTAPYCPRHL